MKLIYDGDGNTETRKAYLDDERAIVHQNDIIAVKLNNKIVW